MIKDFSEVRSRVLSLLEDMAVEMPGEGWLVGEIYEAFQAELDFKTLCDVMRDAAEGRDPEIKYGAIAHLKLGKKTEGWSCK